MHRLDLPTNGEQGLLMIVEFDEVPFHEATVREFQGAPGKVTITLEIEAEPTPDGFQRADIIRVDFTGATDLTQDQRPTQSYSKAADDGELLSLNYSAGRAEIVIEWNEWDPRRTETRVYHFSAEPPFATCVISGSAT